MVQMLREDNVSDWGQTFFSLSFVMFKAANKEENTNGTEEWPIRTEFEETLNRRNQTDQSVE